MCSLMSIIAIKADYISSGNTVYSKLEEYQAIFEEEAYIISYVKCTLLRKEELSDFNINGIEVSVFNSNDGYELYFDDYLISIEVYDDQIVGFKTSKA